MEGETKTIKNQWWLWERIKNDLEISWDTSETISEFFLGRWLLVSNKLASMEDWIFADRGQAAGVTFGGRVFPNWLQWSSVKTMEKLHFLAGSIPNNHQRRLWLTDSHPSIGINWVLPNSCNSQKKDFFIFCAHVVLSVFLRAQNRALDSRSCFLVLSLVHKIVLFGAPHRAKNRAFWCSPSCPKLCSCFLVLSLVHDFLARGTTTKTTNLFTKESTKKHDPEHDVWTKETNARRRAPKSTI